MKTTLRTAAELTVAGSPATTDAFTPRDSGSKISLSVTCGAVTSGTLAVTLQTYQGGAWRAMPDLESDSTGDTNYSLGPQDVGTTTGLLYFDIESRAGDQYRLSITAAGATLPNVAAFAWETPTKG